MNLKKKRDLNKKNLLIVASFALAAIAIILILYFFPRPTGYIIQEPKKQVQFYFYDELTNCPLNGYIFIGNKLVGKTSNGYFNLSYQNYEENFQNKENLSLFGKLGSCFNENLGLLFDKYWENSEIKGYYFLGESLFKFKTQINPNNPARRDLTGFVQPENNDIQLELENINTNKNNLDDLSEINKHLGEKIDYAKDWDFDKETNYWQTPSETMILKQGDCEDYSTALLSLFLAYNNSLNCYNIIFTSHVTTFCHINNYYIIMTRKKQNLKKKLKKLILRKHFLCLQN